VKFDKIIIKTNTAGAEHLSGEFIINGITEFSVEDPKDFLDIIGEKSFPFDYYSEGVLPDDLTSVTMTVYLPQNTQGGEKTDLVRKIINKAKESKRFGGVTTKLSSCDESDWENNWKQFFHPIKIGKKLIIKPSWEDCSPGGRTALEIDPGASFGSGSHETTKLCLLLLEETELAGKSVLDLGCGSGVLGIAACLFGAKDCFFVDIDQNAVETAVKNAGINSVKGSAIRAKTGDVLTDPSFEAELTKNKFDVVLSNISADVLKNLIGFFRSAVKKEGILILSGIISPREKEIVALLEPNGFVLQEVLTENDWVGIKAKRI